MDYLPFLIKSLDGASEIARSNFGKVSKSTTKEGDNNQVLTETDLQIGDFFVKEIEKNFPDYNIIDEEAGVIDKKSKFTWVADPIDGTSNFAAGIPTYGVMLGLLENDQPIAGGIALPSFNQINVAQRGKGASCNGQAIKVSSQDKLSDSLVAYGIDGHQEDPNLTHDEGKTLAKIVLGIRNLRSSNSAYDMAMTAQGKYGGNLNKTSKIWDNVAQQILIEEAGGVCTDFYGKPIDYSNPLSKVDENYTFCAASKTLHQQLQAIIHS